MVSASRSMCVAARGRLLGPNGAGEDVVLHDRGAAPAHAGQILLDGMTSPTSRCTGGHARARVSRAGASIFRKLSVRDTFSIAGNVEAFACRARRSSRATVGGPEPHAPGGPVRRKLSGGDGVASKLRCAGPAAFVLPAGRAFVGIVRSRFRRSGIVARRGSEGWAC